jgi:CRP/FNR family transcriptional regulator
MIRYFAHELADLFKTGQKIRYQKGAIILEPGYASEDVYYIEKGYVKAYQLTEDGDNHLHVIFRQKKIFPLRSAILDLPGTSFYEALTDVTVRKLPKPTFVQALENNHSLAMIVLRKVTAIFDDYVTKLNTLQFTNTRSRLIGMLIHLTELYADEDEGGKQAILQIPLTHQELADLCNMARETVSRTLHELHTKGIVDNKNHHIIINNIENLRAELTS